MPRAGEPPHVLILGGTEEGYALAAALAGRSDLRVTSSLAGATTTPRRPAGEHRVGGFGGVTGLHDWLLAARVALVVDASHPFALGISAQARRAAASVGCAHLRLARPPWQAVPGDRWHRVGAVGAGLDTLHALGVERVFAALGARAVATLARAPHHFVLRGIEPPAVVPPNITWLPGRGPFALAGELALLREQRIEALFCRNSGGAGARAKLDAARRLGLPVVLVEPPPAATADMVDDVAGALAAIEARLFG